MLPTPIKDTDNSFSLLEHTCQRFTLAEIQSATCNFHEALVIGRGGFGNVYKCPSKRFPKVYKCLRRSVKEFAVKRLHAMSNQGALEFEAEVKVLSKLRHGNLVWLVGYCNEGNEMALVYEFMPNGTLKDSISVVNCTLSWLQRLKICVGAARGLDYLHTGVSTQDGVIHRDVKTSNILLDANFAAKISDFGLAKVGPIDQTQTFVSTGVKGTFGYMDPCYFHTGKLTRKSDVYAFGVVLLEVLTGKQAVDSSLDEEQWGLAPWAQDQIKVGNLSKIIDSKLRGQISKKCLKEFACIACLCLSIQSKQRPTMAEVVVKLDSILSQERECANANFVVDEGRFMCKVRSFLTAKVEVMPDGEVGTKHVQESKNQSLRSFTYRELLSATKGFKHIEHSPALNGPIYKGWVDEKTYAPTKCGGGMEMHVRKKRVFKSEIDLKLEDFNHPNLIKLLGYCLNKQQLFSIYELIPDTTLDKCLYRGTLSWVARVKIAIGAAQGLSFLHQRNHQAYGHFKSKFILVDKLRIRLWFLVLFSSTHMLLIPCLSGLLNYQADKLEGLIEDGFGVKSEIYAFGVVLLEILTGKVHDVNRSLGRQKLVKWATPLLADEVNLRMVLDPQILHSYSPSGAFKLAQLVLNCLQPIKDSRPSMDEILQVLYQCYQEETKPV